MISLSKAGTSPQLVATFCMRVDLGWEHVYSQLLQASAGQSSQETRQTRPAGGVATMLLITPIAGGFFLFCSRLPCHVHEAAASDKETVAELRANVCLIFDRDIVITSAGRGRTAWAELKMQHVLAARPVVDVATPPQSDIN